MKTDLDWLTEILDNHAAYYDGINNATRPPKGKELDTSMAKAIIAQHIADKAYYEVEQCRKWLTELVDPLQPKPSDQMIKGKLMLFDSRLAEVKANPDERR